MINFGRTTKRVGLALFLGPLLVVGVACGGSGSESSGGSTAVEAVVPTMPPARFTAVANQSVLTATVAISPSTTESDADGITTTAGITTTGITTAGGVSTETTGAADSAAANPDLERGARSYTKNKCGDCHGEQGEGIDGKGKAIAGTTLAPQEFDTLLRTGNGLGAEHIFGPSAISPGGMTTLYAYVQSLGK